MLERGKLSSAQLACLMFLAVIATSIMGAPSFCYRLARNDMWLSPIIAAALPMALIMVLVGLHRSFPGKSLIEYSPLLLGKWLGKPLGLYFLIITLLENAYQARQFGELMNQFFFKETPHAFIICSLFFVCVLAVRLGAEVIGRVAILYMPLLLTIVLTFALPFFQDIDVRRLLPVMSNGILPILRSSAYLQLWLPMYIYTTFFLPFLSDSEQALKRLLQSLAATILTLTGIMILIIFILNESTPMFNFPFMTLARYLTLFEFIEQFDAVIMFFWVVDVFVRTCVTLYGLTIGLAQWLNLPSYKAISVPTAVLVIAVSFWGIPRFSDFITNGPHITFIYLSAHFAIPMLLFVVALARGKWKSAHSGSSSSSGNSDSSSSSEASGSVDNANKIENSGDADNSGDTSDASNDGRSGHTESSEKDSSSSDSEGSGNTNDTDNTNHTSQ